MKDLRIRRFNIHGIEGEKDLQSLLGDGVIGLFFRMDTTTNAINSVVKLFHD